MQDTFYGMVHTFCANVLITNTSHPESRLLLRRVVQLYHLGLVKDEYEDSGQLFSLLLILYPNSRSYRADEGSYT